MNKITSVLAPAKINLGLKVLPKRQDGYHGIESIFSTVSLCDEIIIELTNEKNVCSVKCDSLELPEINTVSSAYNGCRKVSGSDLPGVNVLIKKKIPSGGGLGGGSSDGASFLKAFNKVSGVNLPYDQLQEIAAMVGSDVFFFLDCDESGKGSAIVTGRGEVVQTIPRRNDLHYLMIFPGVHSSTKEAYSLVDEFYESGRNLEYPSLNELEDIYKGPVENWKFVNTFTSVISKKYSKIERAILDLKNNGALYTDMSGSGSTVFGVFASEKDVETARNALSGSWNVCSCY